MRKVSALSLRGWRQRISRLSTQAAVIGITLELYL